MPRGKDYFCKDCNKLLTDKCSCIECNECKEWSHTSCLKIKKEIEKEYTSNSRLKFFCRDCISSDEYKYDFYKGLSR